MTKKEILKFVGVEEYGSMSAIPNDNRAHLNFKSRDTILYKAMDIYAKQEAKNMFELLKESRDAFVLFTLIDKSKLSRTMVDKIEKITHQK